MDTATVVRLFEDHHAALFRYLARLSGDADVAADAAQEAFVRLIERSPASGATTPRAWLFTVGTRLVLEGGRTRARRVRLLAHAPERAPMSDAPADAHAMVEGDERRRVVADALATLTDKERTALLMQQEGFAHREIAEAVGTTTGSVGTLLARALDRLAARLPLDQEAL